MYLLFLVPRQRTRHVLQIDCQFQQNLRGLYAVATALAVVCAQNDYRKEFLLLQAATLACPSFAHSLHQAAQVLLVLRAAFPVHKHPPCNNLLLHHCLHAENFQKALGLYSVLHRHNFSPTF